MSEAVSKDVSPAWKGAIAAILLLSTFFYWVNFDSVAALVDLWMVSGTYGHGLLAVPIALFLIWREREQLLAQPPETSMLGLGLLALTVVGSMFATLIDVDVVNKVALLLFVALVTWAFAGWSAFRVLLLPFGYLLLVLPIWGGVELLLQTTTSTVVAAILSVVGIPVLLEGNYLTLSVGRFFVDQVCAGLRFVLAGLSIFILFAYLNISKSRDRLLFVGVTLMVLVMVNWLRVFIVVYAGYVTDMQHYLVHDHVGFGWGLFAVTMIPLFMYGKKLSDR